MPKRKPFKRLPTVDEYSERVRIHMDAHGISPDDPNRWCDLALALLAKHEPDFQMESRGKRARGAYVPWWIRFVILHEFLIRRQGSTARNEEIFRQMLSQDQDLLRTASLSVIRSTVYAARRDPEYIRQIVYKTAEEGVQGRPAEAPDWIRDKAEQIILKLSTIKNARKKVTK